MDAQTEVPGDWARSGLNGPGSPQDLLRGLLILQAEMGAPGLGALSLSPQLVKLRVVWSLNPSSVSYSPMMSGLLLAVIMNTYLY